MNQTIFESTQIARKDYKCDACDALANVPELIKELSFNEKRQVVQAKKDNWQIKKGQLYTRAFMKDNNFTWTFRARPEILDICQSLDMWED